jgi:dTDP-4-amino-4,6-dideoxygalactose transaminase
MKEIMSIADRNNLIVIEDACQSLGAALDGQRSGSFGLTGCFSLYPMKMLGGAGDGGIVTTNDAEMAQKIYFLRDHGQNRETGDLIGYGFNSRLDNLQAAILNLKLKYLPQWIERRREIAGMYYRKLSGLPDLELPAPPNTDGRYFDCYQNYVVRSSKRDELVDHLRESGVEVLISWPRPMHHHKALGLNHFSLPETESISKEVVSLPMNTEVSDEEIEYVIDCVRGFFRKS